MSSESDEAQVWQQMLADSEEMADTYLVGFESDVMSAILEECPLFDAATVGQLRAVATHIRRNACWRMQKIFLGEKP